MLPLDRTLLTFLKFFVVLTCVFFWIRLIYLAVLRYNRLHSHRDETRDF